MRGEKRGSRKILVGGLDGATWRLIKPWIERGELPYLKEIIKRSAYGKLKSTFPTSTAPAWTALTSGKNPGKHGYFNFLDQNEILSSNDVKTERIWNILSDKGRKCAVVNVPITYPPEKINGVMISSFLTPSRKKDFTHPPRLAEKLRKMDYKIAVELENFGPRMREPDGLKEIFKKEVKVLNKRCNLISQLLAEEEWDFFIFNLKEIDEVQHLFWDRKDIMLKFWKRVDRNLKKIITSFKEGCLGTNSKPFIFLVSDHGFGSRPSKTFNIRYLLEKMGYIEGATVKSKSSALAERLVGNLSEKVPLLRDLGEMLKALRNNQTTKAPKKHLTPEVEYVNWGHSGGIRINSDEREERIKHKLTKVLKNLRDPNTGVKVIKWVKTREELYSGKFAKKAPEINILPNSPPYRVGFSPIPKMIYKSNIGIPGWHGVHFNGIFIGKGPNIRQGSRLPNMCITDLVPTILYLYGEPIPEDIDGRVLTEIFKE
ncbi:hypothetical protein AKJ45_00220 [candidate division MSBL1 archaeon SCGC-AAA261F19]|uniref:Nucleotide pyrophosphatase n=1 Tax=candidate division MSBL1 archaeon SCGC-AAA261F19 TaxID=1698275 RepID=A0A133VBK5_9EURY|nr:hypothetical protein AKJ45_00220 [candidate division MSBL1 archaeon SCGC-AAA261F19]